MSKPSQEFRAFDALVGNLITVSKTDLQAKVDAHKAEAAQNPRKRGPKPKGVTPSASGASRHDDE